MKFRSREARDAYLQEHRQLPNHNDQKDRTEHKVDGLEVRPINEWPVRIGGLMRCCTETLRLDAGWATEGQVVACLYCTSSIILRDGAFEWIHP